MAIENKAIPKTENDLNKSTIKEFTEDENRGLIKVDTGKLKTPAHFLDELEEDKPIWRIDPIALVILLVAIGFIIFITILVSRMPQK